MGTSLMDALNNLFATLVDYAWGTPLIAVLLVGGFCLLVVSRFLPFLGLRHAIDILRGKYDHDDDPGDITHFQALTTALSSTIGAKLKSTSAVAPLGISVGHSPTVKTGSVSSERSQRTISTPTMLGFARLTCKVFVCASATSPNSTGLGVTSN